MKPLTLDEIMALSDDALAAAVAKRVMGPVCKCAAFCPHIDWNDAMRVFRRLLELGWSPSYGWCARDWQCVAIKIGPGSHVITAHADNGRVAICRAALLAVEGGA